MSFLWGLIMYIICHTLCNVFLTNLTFYQQEKKCSSPDEQFLIHCLKIVLFTALIYIVVLIISLCVEPFADHKTSVLIGNGIGFILGTIHYKLTINENWNKNKIKRELNNVNVLEIMNELNGEPNIEKSLPYRLKRISENPNVSEEFYVCEIVVGIVNLLDAKSRLSEIEFNFVDKIFDKFNNDHSKLILNQDKYVKICINIISHFDMIAPYHKFCGDYSNEQLYELLEEHKKPYRNKAKKLAETGQIFSPEWTKLNKTYKDLFYSEEKPLQNTTETTNTNEVVSKYYNNDSYIQPLSHSDEETLADMITRLEADAEYKMDDALVSKYTKMFKQPFKKILCEEEIFINNKKCLLYRFSPSVIDTATIGTFLYFIIVPGAATRYFASEYSFNNTYVLCEWQFDGEKEIAHINYGEVVSSINDLFYHVANIKNKLKEILI